MAVSARDRAHIRELGALKTASHAQARADHLALPLAMRLQRSWQLYVTNRGTARTIEQTNDPSPFYERARALGLYDS